MDTIHLTATAGVDGVLRLEVPAPAGEYDVTVSVADRPRPAGTPQQANPPFKSTGDPVLDELIRTAPERGWPPGYIEATMGSIDDDTFVRHPQGEYPVRIPFE